MNCVTGGSQGYKRVTSSSSSSSSSSSGSSSSSSSKYSEGFHDGRNDA
jgi:hypothetical protein